MEKNKKKSMFLTLSALTVALLATACGNSPVQPGSSGSQPGSSSASSVEDPILKPTIDVSSKLGYDAGRDVFRNFLLAQKDYIKAIMSGKGEPSCPNKGRSKLLVVPVIYNNQTISDLDDRLTCLNKLFYGEASDTTWQSVRSYFYESSFHQLYFDGEVSKPITLKETYIELANSKNETIYNSVVEEAYELLFGTGCQYEGKVNEWDSDGDGLIDGIYLVPLDSPIDSNKTMGWAFSTLHFYASSYYAKKYPQYKTIGRYGWSSLKFSQNTTTEKPSLEKPDAHTFIHEMGHILGLNDYYNPKTQRGTTAGGSTMQDHNICDHEVYSKYLLGWTSPQAVTDKNTEQTIQITLRPSQTTGDSLILASDWNQTSLDEYLMFEYYTPDNLNQHDATKGYGSTDNHGVNASGIRVWHVDKTIHEAHLDVKDKQDMTYFDPNPVSKVNTLGPDYNYAFPEDIAPEDDHLYNENPDKNQDDDFYTSYTTNNTTDQTTANFYIQNELKLLRNRKSANELMEKEDFFLQGSTFGTKDDLFADFEFHQPASKVDYDISADDWKKTAKLKLPYSVEVTSLTAESAVLTLTKIK